MLWTRLHCAIPLTNSGLHQPLSPGAFGGAAGGALGEFARHPIRSGDHVADHHDKADQASRNVPGPDKACGYTSAGAEPNLQAKCDEEHEIA